MKKRLDCIVGFLLAISLVGCVSKARLKATLLDILPQKSEITLLSTCAKPMGPTVVLFKLEASPAEDVMLEHSVVDHFDRKGFWVRASSFLEFASADSKEYFGAAVGATLLDGKNCLREKTDLADAILFEKNEGLYYRSGNRKIVAVLFDDPPATGAMFLQAR